MNVSKEADRRFVEALKVEDPRRYDNLMKNCLRGQKLAFQTTDSTVVAGEESEVVGPSAKTARISGKSTPRAKLVV